MFNQPQFGQEPQQDFNEQPQYEENNFERATIFERIVALAIDFLSLYLIIYITCYMLIRKMGILSGDKYWVVLIFFYALFILYCGFFTTDGRQTLGKFLVGIKVIDRKTGESLTFNKALLRGAVYFVNLFTAFLGFAIALLNKRRLALEDYISGSEVISVREKSPNESIALSALGTLLMAGLFFYVYYMFFLMPSPYQQELVNNARDQVNKLAYLEEVHKQHFGKYTSDLNRLALISGDPVQLQRDIQKNLKRRGFSIGVNKDGFQISAIAKDKEETVITVNNKD